MKGNFFKELLDIVEQKDVNLYISSIVLKEIEKNYTRLVEEENSKLLRLLDQKKHLSIASSGEELVYNIENSVKNLIQRYEQLIHVDVLKILDYSNDILPEIVDRAIWKKKPFTESKTELKDAIIWITYSKFAEENKLETCILLTDNVSDFCNPEKVKDKVYEIHPELTKDSKRFKVYKSIRELVQSEKETFQLMSLKFSAWLDNQEFNSDFFIKIFIDNYLRDINQKIDRRFDYVELHEIFYAEYYLDGYVTLNGFDINKVEDIEINVFNEECLLSGTLIVNGEVEGYQYNPVRDRGEDTYNFYGEATTEIRVIFSFYYGKDEIPRNFEIEKVEI